MRWLLALLAIAWVGLLVVWVTLQWGILPHIDRWREPIEKQASKALGLSVHIANIDVHSTGLMPAINLRDVRLVDAHQREVLRLPKVVAAISPSSVLTMRLRFRQLLLEAPELDVRRDGQGRIHVGGIQLQSNAASGGADLTDWFLEQHEIAIRHGMLRWSDEKNAAPPLALQDVDLVLRNGVFSHDLRLDATPPVKWGERFSIHARFKHGLLKRASDFEQWSGNLYANLPRADMRELRGHVKLPFELNEGDGALRAWLEFESGKQSNATLDVALRAVKLRLAPELEKLELARISARVSLRHQARHWGLDVKRLSFVTDNAQEFAPTDLSISLQDDGHGGIASGAVSAQQLDLALMAELASKMPLGRAVRQLMQEVAPKGQLKGLQAQWAGPLDAPHTYQVQAALQGLSLSAKVAAQGIGRPGFSNANFQITATQNGGAAQLVLNQGAMDFPGVFEQSQIPLQHLSAALHWSIAPLRPGQSHRPIEVKVSEARFANADAQGELTATWSTGSQDVGAHASGARYPGVLELSGKLVQGQATAVHRYLPLGIPHETRDYVRHAVLAGVANDVRFKVRGDLWDFPFAVVPKMGQQGQFHIALQAKDVVLAYVPSYAATASAPAFASPWPPMEAVSGELVFDRNTMHIRKASAKVLGYELTGVKGGIADLAQRSVLVLEGAGTGGVQPLLDFLRRSPVGGWTGNALALASGTGHADLKLAVQLPLSDLDKTTVKGQLQLKGNDLRIRPDLPMLEQTRAKVSFTQNDLHIGAAQAHVLGGDLSFEGGSPLHLAPNATAADKALRFTGQGTASAEGLRGAGEWPLLARLAQNLDGSTAYRLLLGIHSGGAEFDFTSQLQGLASRLPAPLTKTAEAPLSLRVQTRLLVPAQGDAQQDQLSIHLGSVAEVRYLRDITAANAHVLRGSIGVGERAPDLPKDGVQAHINLPFVSLDQWQAQAQKLTGNSAGPQESADAAASYLPNNLALRTGTVDFGGHRLTQVVAALSRLDTGPQAGTWRSSLSSDQASGYIELQRRNAASGRSGGLRVFGRLARVSLPKSEVRSVETLLDQQPTNLPSLDIVVEDFELRGKRLGRLQVQAQASPVSRDWHLSQLQLSNADATLRATGDWKLEPGGNQRRTQLNLQMELADSGALLDRVGQSHVLRDAKGTLQGQVSWQGSPFSPDYASMSGGLKLALEKGQFLKVEPGAGRLLSVLSMQSLARRFTLDFRDVFDEGFAFDAVTGDVAIKQGILSTQNLRMQGVVAAVLLEGQADLARETQDLHVVMVPDVNAGGASLAYVAVNPALGLTTFLAQWLLSKPLNAANTREFRVTGTFDNPKVEALSGEQATRASSSPALKEQTPGRPKLFLPPRGGGTGTSGSWGR